MDPIEPVINDTTVEIKHPDHDIIAHCDRSTLAEWKDLGWVPVLKPKKPKKPNENDKPELIPVDPPVDPLADPPVV